MQPHKQQTAQQSHAPQQQHHHHQGKQRQPHVLPTLQQKRVPPTQQPSTEQRAQQQTAARQHQLSAQQQPVAQQRAPAGLENVGSTGRGWSGELLRTLSSRSSQTLAVLPSPRVQSSARALSSPRAQLQPKQEQWHWAVPAAQQQRTAGVPVQANPVQLQRGQAQGQALGQRAGGPAPIRTALQQKPAGLGLQQYQQHLMDLDSPQARGQQQPLPGTPSSLSLQPSWQASLASRPELDYGEL